MATELRTKAIRATLTDEELIKQYENELYNKDLSERELISMALKSYFKKYHGIKVDS